MFLQNVVVVSPVLSDFYQKTTQIKNCTKSKRVNFGLQSMVRRGFDSLHLHNANIGKYLINKCMYTLRIIIEERENKNFPFEQTIHNYSLGNSYTKVENGTTFERLN